MHQAPAQMQLRWSTRNSQFFVIGQRIVAQRVVLDRQQQGRRQIAEIGLLQRGAQGGWLALLTEVGLVSERQVFIETSEATYLALGQQNRFPPDTRET